MTVQPIRCPDYAGLLLEAAAFVSAEAKRGEVVVLAYTRAAADAFVRAHHGGGWLGVHRFTPAQLAGVVARRAIAAEGLAPLSALAAEAVAARAAFAARARLAYFHPVHQLPGFPRALARTLNELRLGGVGSLELQARGPAGQDLALLLETYERELRERALADMALVYRLATLEAGENRFAGCAVLLLDAGVQTTAARDFVAALRAHARCVADATIASDGAAPPKASALQRLQRQLFATDTPAAAPDASVQVASHAGESLECIEIARAIREAEIPFDRVAILLRSPERYQPLVEEALRRAGIPAWFSHGSQRPEAAGRAFLKLLECAGDNYSASRFAEYLSLGQARRPARREAVAASGGAPTGTARAPAAEPQPADTNEPEPVFAPVAWERLLVDAAVIGGRERWRKRLAGLREQFQLDRESHEQQEGHAESAARQIALLESLESFAVPMIDRLAALPQQALWGEWLQQLSALAESALERPDRVQAVLDDLAPMADLGPVDLREVMQVLSERLGTLRTEPPEQPYGRVFVGSLDEARGHSFDVVFVPGVAEGMFPRKQYEDPLLIDDSRRDLSAGLETMTERIERERDRLRIAVAAAAKQLVLSYPRVDGTEGRSRVPSFYTLETLHAAEGAVPSLRKFEERTQRQEESTLGWPAPADPRRALDEAEFDIGGLRQSLDSGRRKGTFRYVLDLNSALARSLRARGRRWRPNWFPADGVVDADPKTLAALRTHLPGARAYSPSSLQQFAACPYKFVLYAIQGLRPPEEATRLERMDPLTRGEIYHAVLFRFMQTLEGRGMLDLMRQDRAELVELLDEELDGTAGEYEDRLNPAIPRVWQAEIEDLRRDLRGWLHAVLSEERRWLPYRFEFRFGLGVPGRDHDERSVADDAKLAEGLRVRGSIDLVERLAGPREQLRITDYKTGRPPEDQPVYLGGGAVLQPLLYALAAEQLLQRPVVAGRLFYATHRASYQQIEIPLNDEARKRVAEFTAILTKEIRRGFLPAAPREDECSRCDYRIVCGPNEERRTARKHPDELTALVTLRGMA